jgi:hypothetical protein
MTYENGVFNILEETNTGFKRRKKLSFTQEQFVERLDNYIVQIYAQGHSDYVNKRGYNEKISKEGRLFTDLNYEQHFHSTRVTVETYNPNASSGETIPLADQSISKTKSETSDVEAKKADIERRRQENDTLGKSILQKLGYKNENRLPNGNVKGGQSGWKIRFNIKNPKTGESYYDGKGTTTLLNDDYNKRAETLINFLLNYFGSNEKADSKNLQKHYVLEDKDGTRREPFKHLSGGEIGESDFTIYIGSADDVMKFISDIRTSNPEILKLLHTGNKSGDISIDDIFKGRIEGSEIGFSGYHTPTNLNKVTGSNDFTFNFNQNRVNINYNGNRLSDITIFVEGSNRGYKGVFDENLKNDFPELYKNIRNIVGFQLYGNYLQGSNNEFLKLTGTEEINAKYDAELDASEQSNNNQSDTNTEIEKLKQEWEKELNKIKERLEKHLKEAESEPDSAPKVKIKKADGTIDTNSIRQNAIAAANALYEYSINRINAEYTAKIAALEGTTSNIVSASFTGQGTTLEIEIKGEKKDFLLTWNRNNTNPTLWGNKKEDGSYTTTDAFPSKEDIQKLVDKYVPIKLLNLINEWVEASKLPSEQVLDTQSKIENKINAELKALEQTTPQSSPEELDSKVVNQSAVTEREIENIKDNKNFIILSEDGTHYLNTKTGKKLKRVTGFINEKEAVFPQKQSDESLTDYRKRLVELFKGEEKSEAIVAQGMVLASSQVIGTKVDVLVRDFFDGKLKPLSEYNVSDIKTVEAFVEQLKVLQAKLKKNNEIVVANDIVLYNDELGIAGSVDLLTYDNKGVVRIYDMKTMRGNKFEFNNYGENKYDNTSVFELTGELKVSGEPKYTVNKSEKQDSDRVKHQKQLSLYRILLYNTHGLKADKLTIIPIDVEYTMGDEATSHLDLLDTVTLVPLKEVNGAKLKKPVKTEKKVEPVVESTTEEEIGEIETKPKLTSPDKPKPIVEVEPQVEVQVPIIPIVETTETTTEEKPKPEGRRSRALGKPSDKTTGLSGLVKDDNKPVYKHGTISKNTKLETEKEAEWFKKNFPQVSRYVVDNLREVYKNSPTDGLAMFYKSAMYISKNVPEGTTFHEAFHIIFRLFLTPEQQIGIMEEAKSRYGIPSSFTIKDIIDEHSQLHPEDKPLTGEQATSLYYEELIADEFSEYLQAQEKTAYTLPSKIKRFFQKLYQTIKSVVTSKVSIDDIFMRGNTEYYKNKKVFDRNVSNFRTKYPAFKIAGFKDPKTANRRLNYLRQLVKNEIELFRTSTYKKLAKYDDADLLREIQKTLPKDVSVINKIYIEIVSKINKEINDLETAGDYDMADKFGDLLDALVVESNNKKDENGNYGVKVWGDAYFASIKDLANMGLKFNAVNNSVNNSSENNTEDGLPIFEMNEDETFTEGWMIKQFQVSSKDSISQKLKKFLDSIPIFNTTDIYNTDGSLKLNNVKLGDLNEILYEDGSSIFNYLQRNLHDIYHPDTMVKKLEELSKYKPYAKYVLSKVNADPKLKADLFVYVASKSHVNFGFLKEVLGEFRLFSSNRTTITNMIIQDWYTTFKQSDIVDAEDVINVDIVKPIRDRLLRGIDQIEKGIVTDQTFHALEKISRELGFEISAKTFKSLYVEKGTGKFKTTAEQNLLLFLKGSATSEYSFMTLANLLANGKNVFKEGASESTLLKSLATVLKIFDESNHQSAFKGVDGQSMYSHISSNFMTKMMANLTSPSKEVLNTYLRTKFYMSSPWLNELKYNVETKREFELMLLDGLKPENAEDGKKYTELSPAELYSTLMNAYSNNNNGKYGYYGVPTLSDAPVEAFVKFKKYSLKKDKDGNSEILDAIYEAALQEYNRIELVKRELNSENLITKIKNKFTGDRPHGLDFQMFTFLNKYKLDMGNGEVGRQVVIPIIEAWLNERYVEEVINLKELKLIKTSGGKITFNKHIIDKRITDHNAFLREFIYNDILANSQLITIFSGDPASYKQKTLVEDFFKRNKQIWSPGLHMDITVPGVKPTYKTIIANDSINKDISKIYNNAIEKTLANLGYNNKVVQDILKAYDEVNETDAQGYVDIIRYKEIMLGFNRWTDKHEAALPNLIAGTATSDEIRLVLQPIKPFYFGHIILPNGEINAMQNKNSEYLLLPQLAKGNKKLEKLMNQFGYNFNGSQVSYLEENRKTDSIQFDSAVKVGLYGNVDLDNIDNAVVHTLNNSDYKLQVETPEHHIDADNLFGSQIRKLIMSDINVDGDYELPTLPDSLIEYLTSIGITLNEDNTIKGGDLIRLYQEVIVKDINDAFDKEVKRFGDFKSLIQALREEVEARDLGQQYLEALEFVDGTNTETVLPLYHPLHAKRIEEILNSFFKNNVTKQKIPGGSFINVSSYGLDTRLNIKFKDDQTIDYIEAMMPPWSKDFFREGELISIEKLNQLGLADAMLYRIPTEDKYSMFNIKVVGFLPDASGGVVMLPTEITTIAGLDFDVDKVFAMFYSFKKSAVDNIVDVVQVNGKDTSGFNNLIRIDSGINSKEARDNLKIDIIRAIMKNKSSVEPFLNTGNFEIIKETAKSIIKYEAGRRKSDIENSSDNTLKGTKLTQELGLLNLVTTKTKIEIFNRNMTGKTLIGIFANHNSNHALTQHSNLELTTSINFNGASKSSLHETKDTDGNRISKSLATLLAAVVDNAKEPISNFLNLNTYTADTVAMIVRSGHTLKTALTFVSQPSIKELTKRYFNEKGKISEDSLFNEISKELEKNLKDKLKGVKLESGEIPNLNIEDLFKNIEKWGQGKEDYDYHLQQYYAFENFKKYKRAADDLAEFVKAGRVDTTGAGPTISENEYRITLVENVIKKSKNGDSVLLGVEEFFSKDSNTKMVDAFYTKGILEPNEILKKYFPWGEQQFLDIKKLLAKYKGGYLTISELELINYNILTYLASGYEFFDFKYSENIRKELPKRLLSYQSKHKDGNFSKFLNHLHVKDNTKPGQTQKDLFIEFIGTAGITKLDRDIIRNVWQEMLESSESTDEEKQLAEDLIKYTYFTAGFTFTPYSFSHLVPTSFFSKLGVDTEQSFNEYLKKSIEETKQNSDIDSKLLNFTHQFIRNYYHKLGSIVPTVKYDSSENSDPLFDNVKSVSLSGRGKIDVSGDKISLFQSEDGSFKPFIQYEDEKIVYLFEKSKGDNTLYHLTEKLGKVNTALEYDMNTFQPRSTIKQNKKNIPDIIDTDVTAQYSRMIQQMGYEVEDIDYSDLTDEVDTSQEETESTSNVNEVEIFKGNWTREEVAKQTDKVFLFGDNTNDRLITNYIPKSTQAVIRGLPNAIGIDTKKDRGTIEDYNLDIVGKVIEIETNNYDFFKSKIDSIERKANNFLVKATNSKGKQYTYLVDSQGQPVNKNSFFEYVELPKKFYTNSYFEDSDFDVFKQQVDEAIQQAKNSGKTIVIPADGIGTGKAMLKEKAPKLFEYLQQELNNLKSQVKTSNQLTESKPTKKLKTLLTDPNQLSLFDADKFIEKGLENGDIKRKDC